MVIAAPKRRRFQFSLRALVVFTAIVAIGLSFALCFRGWLYESEPVLDAVRRHGGTARSSYALRNGKSAPAWMGRLGRRMLELRVENLDDSDEAMRYIAGIGSLQRLTFDRSVLTCNGMVSLAAMSQLACLEFRRTRLPNSALSHVAKLTGLRRLSLVQSHIGDEPLRWIGGLNNLESLALDHTEVTDQGLVLLSRMVQLEAVALRGTRVGDAGVRHLECLHGLRFLDISGTKITDAAGAHLGRMKRLETLLLRDTALGDGACASFCGLERLQALDLSGTRITDGALVFLGRMPQLEVLRLEDTKITDAALANLKGLTRLRVLCVNGTGVSTAAVEALGTALPCLRRPRDGGQGAPHPAGVGSDDSGKQQPRSTSAPRESVRSLTGSDDTRILPSSSYERTNR